jgi:hypothetical protein
VVCISAELILGRLLPRCSLKLQRSQRTNRSWKPVMPLLQSTCSTARSPMTPSGRSALTPTHPQRPGMRTGDDNSAKEGRRIEPRFRLAPCPTVLIEETASVTPRAS